MCGGGGILLVQWYPNKNPPYKLYFYRMPSSYAGPWPGVATASAQADGTDPWRHPAKTTRPILGNILHLPVNRFTVATLCWTHGSMRPVKPYTKSLDNATAGKYQKL